MTDLYLRGRVVPPDGTNDVRLYPDGADLPPAGGVVPWRMLMGLGLAWLLMLNYR